MYSESSVVKLIKRLDVTDLSGEKVMIDFGTGKYFLLKGVANDIWDLIQEPISVEKILQMLLSEYEIDAGTCSEAIKQFLQQLVEYQFIEIIEDTSVCI